MVCEFKALILQISDILARILLISEFRGTSLNEGWIIPRVIDWHHEACRVMTNGDCEGRIIQSHPHLNNVFFFLLTTKYFIYYWKNINKTSKNTEFAELRHGDVNLTLQ